jgi:hypothetical protein
MSIDALTIPRLGPYRPGHHPRKQGRPTELPKGLDDGTILRLRRKAEKMAVRNNVRFAVVFAVRVLSALTEAGLARLSMKQIIELANTTAGMPQELAVTIMAFIAAHPPAGGDHAVMAEMIQAGALGGTANLIRLHKFIEDRLRKRAARRLQPLIASGSDRPKLKSKDERAQARVSREEAEAKAEIEQANAALTSLYARRLNPELRRHLSFIEAAMALKDAGYGLIERHRKQVLEIVTEA